MAAQALVTTLTHRGCCAALMLQATGSSAPDYQRLLGFMDRMFCFNRFAARCALPALMSRSGYDMETLMPVQVSGNAGCRVTSCST